MVVRIAACCTSMDIPSIQQGIRQFSENCNIYIHGEFYEETSEFLEALERDSLWDFLIVALPGARGMETVIGAREFASEIPLLWCSDDEEFAVASYRLRCSLFMPLPLQPGNIETALQRCIVNNS